MNDRVLGGNAFEGSMDLTRLPESMKRIHLDENMFSGTIDLGHLPENLDDLDVSFNERIC